MGRSNHRDSDSDSDSDDDRAPRQFSTTDFGAGTAPPVRVGGLGPATYETMNLGPAPVRVVAGGPGAASYETINLGPGPVRVPGAAAAAAFETMQFDAPIRVTNPPANDPHPTPGGYAFNKPINTGETPMISPFHEPIQPEKSSSYNIYDGPQPRPMPNVLVIAEVILRPLGAVLLLIAMALIIPNSNFQASATTKYLLTALVTGLAYEIYQTIVAIVRIATGHHLIPGSATLYISYISDQIFLALLLTAGAASAAFLKDLETVSACSEGDNNTFCAQTTGSTSLAFLASLLLVASSVISSFCFFTNKI